MRHCSRLPWYNMQKLDACPYFAFVYLVVRILSHLPFLDVINNFKPPVYISYVLWYRESYLIHFQRCGPQVRLHEVIEDNDLVSTTRTNLVDRVLREESFCFLIRDSRVNNNIVAFLPVHWRRDAVFIPDLKSWENNIRYFPSMWRPPLVICLQSTTLLLRVTMNSLEKWALDLPEDFVEVAPSRCWVRNGQSYYFFRIDNEDCADGERNAFRIPVCCVLLIKHVIEGWNFPVRISNLWSETHQHC